MVTAWLGSLQGLNLGLPGWLSVPITLSAALLLGIVIGLFNALLVLRVGVTAFIATLATYIFFRGTVVAFNGGKGIFGLNPDLRAVATFRVFGVPGLVVITISIFIIFSAILRKTPFGRYLYLLGGNAVAPFSRWNSCRQGCGLGLCDIWVALGIRWVVARRSHCGRNSKFGRRHDIRSVRRGRDWRH